MKAVEQRQAKAVLGREGSGNSRQRRCRTCRGLGASTALASVRAAAGSGAGRASVPPEAAREPLAGRTCGVEPEAAHRPTHAQPGSYFPGPLHGRRQLATLFLPASVRRRRATSRGAGCEQEGLVVAEQLPVPIVVYLGAGPAAGAATPGHVGTNHRDQQRHRARVQPAHVEWMAARRPLLSASRRWRHGQQRPRAVATAAVPVEAAAWYGGSGGNLPMVTAHCAHASCCDGAPAPGCVHLPWGI